MSEREPGWYWVKVIPEDDWQAVEWGFGSWTIDGYARRADPDVIGPRILPPDAQPAPRGQPNPVDTEMLMRAAIARGDEFEPLSDARAASDTHETWMGDPKLWTVVDLARRLANDVGGCFHFAEPAVREAIGNTNYSVIMKWRQELVDALVAIQAWPNRALAAPAQPQDWRTGK